MIRFLAGVAVTIAVQLLGWPRIEAAFHAAGAGAQRAYQSAQTQLESTGGGK